MSEKDERPVKIGPPHAMLVLNMLDQIILSAVFEDMQKNYAMNELMSAKAKFTAAIVSNLAFTAMVDGFEPILDFCRNIKESKEYQELEPESHEMFVDTLDKFIIKLDIVASKSATWMDTAKILEHEVWGKSDG
jgi:hypothetical protein